MKLEYPTTLCLAGMNIYEFDHKVSAGITAECQGKQPVDGVLSGAGITRPRTTYYTYHDEEYAQVPLNALTSPCWHPFPFLTVSR